MCGGSCFIVCTVVLYFVLSGILCSLNLSSVGMTRRFRLLALVLNPVFSLVVKVVF